MGIFVNRTVFMLYLYTIKAISSERDIRPLVLSPHTPQMCVGGSWVLLLSELMKYNHISQIQVDFSQSGLLSVLHNPTAVPQSTGFVPNGDEENQSSARDQSALTGAGGTRLTQERLPALKMHTELLSTTVISLGCCWWKHNSKKRGKEKWPTIGSWRGVSHLQAKKKMIGLPADGSLHFPSFMMMNGQKTWEDGASRQNLLQEPVVTLLGCVTVQTHNGRMVDLWWEGELPYKSRANDGKRDVMYTSHSWENSWQEDNETVHKLGDLRFGGSCSEECPYCF